MNADSFLLYLFSFLLLLTSFKVISCRNPARGALYLALSMILLAFIFFLLSAPFLAGLQLIIYAGAVMVLFVMVLMLFDLKKESETFSKSSFKSLIPIFLFGFFASLISLMSFSSLPKIIDTEFLSAKQIALNLFNNYVLIFELMGLLLLVVAIAVVALAKLDED